MTQNGVDMDWMPLQAFSCISTGVYGFPGPRATEIALSEVRKFLEGPDGAKLDLVVFCM